jgi:lysophospholipase
MEITEIPTTNTFVNKGLNQRPVFFGCNTTTAPLIVYVPHYPWTYYSNSTTFTLQYDTADATDQMLSSMRSLTLNGTVPSWPKCLSCAMTDRANGYTEANRTAECAQCFSTWCWDGETDDTEPASEYAPVLHVTPEFLVKNNLSTDVRTAGTVLQVGAGATLVALAISMFAML